MATAGPLGRYLRARRELLDPSAVGLRTVGVRRTPGLRREELAMLAGISTDYYLRLEQGRDRNPSRQVVEALARGLCLDEAATGYLLDLATGTTNRSGRRSGAGGRQVIPAGIRELLATVAVPAFVEDRRFDILAINPLATALDPSIAVGANRMRTLFLDDQAALLWGDQERTRRDIVASFRASIGSEIDARTQLLVGELSLASDDFRRLWARHDVAVLAGGLAHLNHPLFGPIDLRRHKFPVGGTDGLLLAVYHPAPGSASAIAMAQLAQAVAGASKAAEAAGTAG